MKSALVRALALLIVVLPVSAVSAVSAVTEVTAVTAEAAIELVEVASGLRRPLGLVSAEDGTGRLFILEQGGLVKVLEAGAVRGQPFLDLSDLVSCCDERGLLGLAFHPDYKSNGSFFVDYTDLAGDTVVSRFSVSSVDPNRADADSEIELLAIDQPFGNHNGGHLAFGPDGYLYIASGDGGAGGDPQNNAQNLDNLLGKILRVDVDGSPVAIPPDNPFVDEPGAVPEIWAYGLRNPWRFSFDRETGDLFVGDVGQGSVEEIDLQPAGSPGGENFGWRRMEGSQCFNPANGCNTGGSGELVLPILEYGHVVGCSVTGGFRYRGTSSPGLVGTYIFGDFCSGRIWGAEPDGNGVWSSSLLADTDFGIASFGEDDDGEIYVVDLGGAIYRLASTALFRNGFESGDFSGWKRKGKPKVVRPGLDGTAFALSVSAGAGRPRVRTRSPDRESELSVEFFLDPSALDQLVLDETILTLSDGQGTHAELTLEKRSRKFRVALYVQEPGGRRRIGRTKISGKRATRLGLSWRAASAAGNRDGSATLVKKGRGRGSKVNLDTSGQRVDQLEAGFPFGTKAGSGELLFDEFVLSR